MLRARAAVAEAQASVCSRREGPSHRVICELVPPKLRLHLAVLVVACRPGCVSGPESAACSCSWAPGARGPPMCGHGRGASESAACSCSRAPHAPSRTCALLRLSAGWHIPHAVVRAIPCVCEGSRGAAACEEGRARSGRAGGCSAGSGTAAVRRRLLRAAAHLSRRRPCCCSGWTFELGRKPAGGGGSACVEEAPAPASGGAASGGVRPRGSGTRARCCAAR